jgi:hypothetical protein
MTHSGKCPKCDKLLAHVKADRIPVGESLDQIKFNGVSFFCPFCSAILGVSIDLAHLTAMKVEAVAQIQTYVRLSSEDLVRQAMHETTQELDRILTARLGQNEKSQ